LKEIIVDIVNVLSPREKKQLYYFTAGNTIISVLDIASLAALVFIIGIYNGSVGASFLPQWLLANNAVPLVGIFLLFFVTKNYLAVVMAQKQLHYIYGVATRISKENIENYLDGDYRQYVDTDSSVFVRKISLQPTEFAQHLLFGFQQSFTQAVLILAAVAALLIYDARAFVFLLMFLAPVVVVMTVAARKRMKKARAVISGNRDHTLQYLNEGILGYVEANIYDGKDFFSGRYTGKQHLVNASLAELQLAQQLPARMIEVFAVLGLFLLVMAGTFYDNESKDMLVHIGAFMAAAYKLIPGAVKLINLTTQMRAYHTALSGMVIPGRPQSVGGTGKHISSIRLENLGFSITGKQLFKNVDTEFCRGDFALVQGLSGKGKTTLLNLVLGFLEQEHGLILYNNQATTTSSRKQYWSRVSYVKQDCFLVNDSVLKNIILGQAYDHERVNLVMKVTGLDELLIELPGGLDYNIRESGRNLSGGQKQRIAIARAIYKSADVYILDEPFNGLDAASEKQIMEYFSKLALAGRIVILITHNNRSFSFCNKVLQLHEA
jgi:ABC-type multidrug transport system fused ATPase/permease subunit